jgi:hypothetical protein
MSIEALIQAHIQALLANTEAVKLLTLSLAGRTPTAERPKPGKAAETKQEEPKQEVKELKEIESKEEPPILLDHTPVPYETVRALVLKLAGGGKREGIQALWAKYSIANLKVLLDDEKDTDSVNDQAKLEAVYADLQALEG